MRQSAHLIGVEVGDEQRGVAFIERDVGHGNPLLRFFGFFRVAVLVYALPLIGAHYAKSRGRFRLARPRGRCNYMYLLIFTYRQIDMIHTQTEVIYTKYRYGLESKV